MSTDDDSLFHSMSEAGIAAEHSPLVSLPVLAAPSTEDQFNTLRPALKPIACWSIGDARFTFGSSFVRPRIAEDAGSLAALVRGLESKYDERPLAAVFGHADPVGNDDFNKKLSGRRAAAVYAFLTRRTDIWEDIFSQKGNFTSVLSADNWGDDAINTMLSDLGYVAAADDQEIAANSASEQTDPVTAFQHDHGLAEDGDPGPKTRDKLFGVYMDKRCRNHKDEPFKLEAADFLGRGADASGKGDFQGCSEFNPLLIFSEDQHKELSKTEHKAERDRANAPNRRVLMYFFHPETRVELGTWPCPRAKEGTAACRKRLWVDADDRRSSGPDRRLYEATGDTFACRFYDRLARESPCERVLEPVDIQIRLFDYCQRPMPGARCRVTFGPTVLDLTANKDAFVNVRALTGHTICLVEWSEAPESDDPIETHAYRKFAFLRVDAGTDDGAGVKRRLWNLGYPVRQGTGIGDQDDLIRRFKEEYRERVDLGDSGEVDGPTRDALTGFHDDCDPIARSDHGRVVPRYSAPGASEE
jgi:hypothetical protein